MPTAEPPRPRLSLQDVFSAAGLMHDRLSAWRMRRRSSPAWTVAVALILLVVLLPVGSVLWMALTTADSPWRHLVSTVLPRSLATTFGLLVAVGALTLIVGAGTAWIVTMYRFPGRALLDRLLVIPLAMPTYVVAYCFVDLLDYSGPVQSFLRSVFGWRLATDYWFPQIRSFGGAVLVLSAVLYPYVYLSARASFVQQSVCALEVARTLGCTPIGAFRSVALPMARPALAAGVVLVLMECLNDLGAVQHLGVETLAQSVYTTWLRRSSIAGAAQIALVMLSFVAALIVLENLARGDARFHHTTGRYRSIPFSDLQGWRAMLAFALCVVPFLLGFVLPCLILLRHAVLHYGDALAAGFWRAMLNSLLLAAIAAAVTTALAILVAYARRVAANGFTRPAVRLVGLGYALPGTVLALGLMFPLAAIDNVIDTAMRTRFAISPGLLISGSLVILVVAYTIRFLAVGLGSVEAGLQRISPNLDAAARTLGESAMTTLLRVHLPLLMPALGAAGLLVFVDAMKELPATLLLRPFNFETLATHVYAHASLEQLEHAALGALAIVAAGLVPVLLLHKAVASGRAGH